MPDQPGQVLTASPWAAMVPMPLHSGRITNYLWEIILVVVTKRIHPVSGNTLSTHKPGVLLALLVFSLPNPMKYIGLFFTPAITISFFFVQARAFSRAQMAVQV